MAQARNASTALTHSSCRTIISKPLISTLFLVFTLLLSACEASTGATPTPTTTGASTPPVTSTPQQTVTSGPGITATTALSSSTATPASGYPIKVYFSKFPNSLKDFTVVFPVNRSSPTIAVATFSIQLLIAGPTLSERNTGYFSEFNSILSGPSSCSAPYPTGGPDFTLTLNMKGSKPSPGTATLRLCRVSSSPGTGADARILAEINATLKQFSNIKSVVVLTQAGNCFGDKSGQNRCLK